MTITTDRLGSANQRAAFQPDKTPQGVTGLHFSDDVGLAERTELATVGCGRKVPLHTLRAMLSEVDDDREFGLADHASGDSGEVPLVAPALLDEAAIDDERTLLHTVDVVLPLRLTPEEWGRVVALHCVSDIYAAGGVPHSATGILHISQEWHARGWHVRAYRAALSELKKLGVTVVGGHTLRSPQMSMGFAVTSVCRSVHVRRRRHAQPGDVLLLTKPIGGGLVLGGGDAPSNADARRAVVESMLTSNERHSRLATELGVQASTDVTGYGLLGSCIEVADSASVAIKLDPAAVPVFEGIDLALANGIVSPLADSTMLDSDAETHWPELSIDEKIVLSDPQVSGGLLLAMPEKLADEYLRRANDAGLTAWRVGAVIAREPGEMVKVSVVKASSTPAPGPGQ